MTVEQALARLQGGNLLHLRLVAAAAVIISHAWPLAYGPGASEPLRTLSGHSLGGWAVALFFFLSGMLIYTSAGQRGPLDFWMARGRRILPGLSVALAVTVILALSAGSTANVQEACLYLLRGISLFSLEHRLPNAFAANPYPLAVNGPLWSLSHEIMAYALCQAAVRLRLLHRPWGLVALLGGSLALWGLASLLPGRLATFAPLWLAFAFGMAVARLAGRLPLSPVLALILVATAPLGWPFAVAALGYGALTLALRLPPLPRGGDMSFGLYIYGWPVAQVLLHIWPGLNAPQLACASLAATIPFAALSWYLVERTSLAGPASPKAKARQA